VNAINKVVAAQHDRAAGRGRRASPSTPISMNEPEAAPAHARPTPLVTSEKMRRS
jgi:hypothetical protein